MKEATPRERSAPRSPESSPAGPGGIELAGILEDTEDIVTLVDDEARLLWVNPAAERVFGVSREDCLGRSAFEFIHVEDRERTRRAFEHWVRAPGTRSFSFANRQVSLDGTTRHVVWKITRREGPDGELLHLASTAHDVTDIHRREARLARSEARLRALLRGTLDALVVIDDHGIVQDASESVREVFGWEPELLIGHNVRVLMPEPFRSEHGGYLHRYRRTGDTAILDTVREFPAQRRDGSLFTCELGVSRVDVPGGETLFVGSIRDVSERQAAQRALRLSEARFHAIFDQEFQSVCLLDPDGALLEINAAGLGAAGLTRDAVIGRPVWTGAWLRHDSAQARVIEAAVRKAAGGEIVRERIEILTEGGAKRSLDCSVKPLVGEDGEVQLLILEGRDITALVRAQERETGMLRALARLGESASFLAHEVKNPLTAVNFALCAVAEKLGEDQRVVVEDLAGRLQRLEGMLRRTLAFAKPLELELEPVEVARTLRDLARLFEAEATGRGVELVVEHGPPELAVRADGVLLEELLTNLVRNAFEAVSDGGRITLRARADGDDVVLEVEDDGPGVSARALEGLFDPYRSSKQGGTGFGLAFCRKIAEEHGGSIDYFDRAGGGALFRAQLARER